MPAPSRLAASSAAKHLLTRADVDALRRLVEQDQLRFGLQPFADQRLLLIAAGQAPTAAGSARWA